MKKALILDIMVTKLFTRQNICLALGYIYLYVGFCLIWLGAAYIVKDAWIPLAVVVYCLINHIFLKRIISRYILLIFEIPLATQILFL